VRELRGRIPAPSARGYGLRAASALLASARFVGRGETKQLLALLAQLAALSDAVTRLREPRPGPPKPPRGAGPLKGCD